MTEHKKNKLSILLAQFIKLKFAIKENIENEISLGADPIDLLKRSLHSISDLDCDLNCLSADEWIELTSFVTDLVKEHSA